ncbi:MAG: hypothetical protein EHM46_01735 [Bacteroidetes bacterium]|nr:MAG: hypothetical protein EHM46_01735 [Bacteroidota bacterium]
MGINKASLAILHLLLLPWSFAMTQDTVVPEKDRKVKPFYHEVSQFVEENEASCLKCHGEEKYILEDTLFGRSLTQRMYADLIVDRDAYYSGVHGSFSCTDCHSYDFEVFPHSLEARLEESYTCLDCHGYDENYAHYQFEEIDMEFSESIHNFEGFSCWKCHDPHSYKPSMREAESIMEAITYNNNICLVCHANFDRFMLLTDREEINVVERHDWLPNQVAHFEAARCLECHAEISDTVLVAHQVLPVEQAVQRCAECHSRDSRLMHTLYKYRARQERQAGFVNGVIINDSFVIGANRIPWLDRLSIAVFALALLVILIHVIFRIIK